MRWSSASIQNAAAVRHRKRGDGGRIHPVHQELRRSLLGVPCEVHSPKIPPTWTQSFGKDHRHARDLANIKNIKKTRSICMWSKRPIRARRSTACAATTRISSTLTPPDRSAPAAERSTRHHSGGPTTLAHRPVSRSRSPDSLWTLAAKWHRHDFAGHTHRPSRSVPQVTEPMARRRTFVVSCPDAPW